MFHKIMNNLFFLVEIEKKTTTAHSFIKWLNGQSAQHECFSLELNAWLLTSFLDLMAVSPEPPTNSFRFSLFDCFISIFTWQFRKFFDKIQRRKFTKASFKMSIVSFFVIFLVTFIQTMNSPSSMNGTAPKILQYALNSLNCVTFYVSAIHRANFEFYCDCIIGVVLGACSSKEKKKAHFERLHRAVKRRW